MSVSIEIDEIEAHRPDMLLPPDAAFAEEYAEAVRFGRERAVTASVAIVGICSNAMPFLPHTLRLIEETGAMFREWSAYLHENDSSDDTKDVLMAWQDQGQRCVSLNFYGRPRLNHTISAERTRALAEYRTSCQRWVRHGKRPDFVVVVENAPWGGWSIDGVATSIAHMERGDWWGLASFSWCEMNTGHGSVPLGYDAWARRSTRWHERSHDRAHNLHLPVGSGPVEMNVAFGQLAVYRADAYLRGRYSGETVEHGAYHRSIAEHPETRGRFGLNPSSRVVSFWMPRAGRQPGMR